MRRNPTRLLIVLALLPALGSALENWLKSGAVRVQGQFFCNDTYYSGKTVELWKRNYFGPDQRIITGATNEYGEFELEAAASELFFDPKIYLYLGNYCNPANYYFLECGKTIKIYVPPPLVTDGHFPKQTFHLGNVDISTTETELVGLDTVMYSLIAHKQCREKTK